MTEATLMRKLEKLSREVSSLACDQLARPRTEASKIIISSGSYSQSVVDAARRLRDQLDKRERELETLHLAACRQKNNIAWQTCRTCGASKPLDDSYFGFGFRDGLPKRHCKACLRDQTKKYHEESPDIARTRARRLGESREDSAAFIAEMKELLRKHQAKTCAYCGTRLDTGGEI